MRSLPYAIAAALLSVFCRPGLGQAPKQFKDAEPRHWAWQAVEELSRKGILQGYPDGHFRGRRTVTRYELAVALAELLKVPRSPYDGPSQPSGIPGIVGPQGETGPRGPAGTTPDDVAVIRKLVAELTPELKQIGLQIASVNQRVDSLESQVVDLAKRVNRLPTISGILFGGARSDYGSKAYVDGDGRVSPLGNKQAVVHGFALAIGHTIAPNILFRSQLVADNYLGYLGGDTSRVLPAGGGSAAGPSVVPVDVRLQQLSLTVQMQGALRGSNAQFGRQPFSISPLMLWRPPVDSYFKPGYLDDGKYIMDGLVAHSHLGSVGVEYSAGSLSSVQGTTGSLNLPLAGAGSNSLIPGHGAPIFVMNMKPVGQAFQGQMAVSNLATLNFTTPITVLNRGYLRVGALASSHRAGAGGPAGQDFSGLWVIAADTRIGIYRNLTFRSDWAKTTTHNGNYFTIYDHTNQAFNMTGDYTWGKLSLMGSYRFVDPQFAAPGYWGRIGNWLNPTNIVGNRARATYRFGNRVTVSATGEYYRIARERSDWGSTGGGLGKKDHIGRLLTSVEVGVTPRLKATADWESVTYMLKGFHTGIPNIGPRGTANAVNPQEQYITMGLGYRVAPKGTLNVAYQYGAFDGHGALSNGPTGFKNYFGAVTTGLSVQF